MKELSCDRKPGMVYGHITLVSSERRQRKSGIGTDRYWTCKCVCGKTVERRDDYLKRCPDNNFSCGCQHSMHILGQKHKLWRGCGDISGFYFAMIKAGAKKRGISFDITIEDMWNLFLEQDGVCMLTGLKLSFKTSYKKRTNPGESTASLDRIDSSKGYTKDNIQWVHKDVNKMKNGYTEERFKEICRLVTERSS